MIRTAVGLALLSSPSSRGLVLLPVSLAADAPVASAPGADKPTAPAATPAHRYAHRPSEFRLVRLAADSRLQRRPLETARQPGG